MSDERPPENRIHLTLDLHADDIRHAIRALEGIAYDLAVWDSKGREDGEVTSGGYHSSHHLSVKVTDPEQTGDRYREQLQAWFEKRKAARQEARQEARQPRDRHDVPRRGRWL